MKKRSAKTSFSIFIALLVFLAAVAPAQASTWLRLDTEVFTILYTEQNSIQAHRLSPLADQIYKNLAETTGYSATTPVLVRLYPDEQIYQEVNLLGQDNGLALQDPTGNEIAIILSRTETYPTNNLKELLMAGVAQFFIDDITNGNFPWPLAIGFGEYYAGPDAVGVQEILQNLSNAHREGKLLSWAELFQPDIVFEDANLTHAESYSLVSFLIDRYGLLNFIELLSAFNTEPGYRSAIESTYGISAGELETQWHDSLHSFIQQRWQFNVFHNYDLTYAQNLLGSGAYSAAETELNKAIQIMSITGQGQGVTQAEALLVTASKGQQASDLVTEARQALEANQYEDAQKLIEQGREAFAKLDDDSREEELARYEARVQQVFAARAQLQRVTRLLATGQLEEARTTLDEATAQLHALGDSEGVAQARQVYGNINSLTNWISGGLLSLGILLFLLNLYLRWRGRKQKTKKTETSLI